MVQPDAFNKLVSGTDGLKRHIVTPIAGLLAVVCGALLNFMPANEPLRLRNGTSESPLVSAGRQFVRCEALPDFTLSKQIVIDDLPRGTIVIVGSTDLSAAMHSIRVTASSAVESDVPYSNLRHPVVVVNNAGRPAWSRLNSTGLASPADFASGKFSVPDDRATGDYCVPETVRDERLTWCASPDGRVADGLSECPTSACQPASELYQRLFLSPAFTDEKVISRPIRGICLHQSSRSLIYCSQEILEQADAVQRQRLLSDAVGIGRELDETVLPVIESMLRPVSDVDHNNHLTILIGQLDLRRDIRDAPIRGCVRADDLLGGDQSPAGDIIYLDQHLPSGGELRALLSHEAAYVAVYSAVLEYLQQNPDTTVDEACCRMPAWLNEAIAHTIERRLAPGTDNFQTRIDAYRRATALSPVVASTEPDRLSERRGGTRAAATLFLESLLNPEMDMSTLLSLNQPAIRRIEELGGQSFPEVFRCWCIRIAESEQASVVPEQLGNGKPDPNQSITYLIRSDASRQLQLRGTAACYLKLPDGTRQLTVFAADTADLQVTILPDVTSMSE